MHMTVERVSYLHERKIDELMHTIRHSFRPDIHSEAQIIRKAISIVRRGTFLSTWCESDGSAMEATLVDDGEAIDVKIAFPETELTCSCEESEWCEHKISIVFYLYSRFQSLTEWQHDWQRREVEQMALSISERTPKAWNSALYRLTKPLREMDSNESPNVFIHEASLLDQKVIPLSPFEYEWKPLFELFYRMHLIDSAWEYLRMQLEEINHFTYRQWQVQTWLNEQISKLRSQVQALGRNPRPFETDAFYDALKIDFPGLVLGHKGLFEARLDIYSILWDFLYRDQTSKEKELASLREHDSADAPFFAAYFYLTQGDDESLKIVAEKAGGELLDHWLPLADKAAEMEEYEALSIIMNTIFPHISSFFKSIKNSNEGYHFIRKIDGLLEEAAFTEEKREELFMLYGSAGVDTFGDFLIERKRFAEWAALMHRFNVPYDGIDPNTLKFVLSNDSAAVMPLLHTYAMRFIEEKNRHSYRRAVRLFKNMKAGAKKSGKADFWNRYIDTVREQFKRLRALSEEMEKGNLNL
ncbi:hypothetical protein NSQ43_16175 [Sporosarcina sp. FSL W8-0480]|uniref:hypothetical protein n=1 Tax=Sporosarcina sp. FSL W8-0480 TaxID=2954701 RepID=UPI0030D7A977